MDFNCPELKKSHEELKKTYFTHYKIKLKSDIPKLLIHFLHQ